MIDLMCVHLLSRSSCCHEKLFMFFFCFSHFSCCFIVKTKRAILFTIYILNSLNILSNICNVVTKMNTKLSHCTKSAVIILLDRVLKITEMSLFFCFNENEAGLWTKSIKENWNNLQEVISSILQCTNL